MGDYVMQGPIEAMYRAGKQDIPAQAQVVASASNSLFTELDTVNTVSAAAGEPTLLKAMLEIGEQVYIGVRQAAQSMDASAVAIIATADDFVRTNDAAAQDFAHLSSSLKDAPVSTHSLDPGVKPGDWTHDGSSPHVPPPLRDKLGDHVDPSNHSVGPTPDPTSSTTADHDHRDQTEQNGKNTNPLPRQPSER